MLTLPSLFQFLPLTQKSHQEVPFEGFVQHLRNEVEVGNQRGLQDNGNVRGVEKFNGIGSHMASNLRVFERKVHSEPLEVNHHEINEHGRNQLVYVRQMTAIKGLLQSPDFVFLSHKGVEKR